MIHGLDLNLLAVFDAIYTAKNISHAAELLNLSQPAVSNSVSRLRKQLNDPLFVRSGNGVMATARAEELIDPIREVLSTLDKNLSQNAPFNPMESRRHFNLLLVDPLEAIVMRHLLQYTKPGSQLTFSILPPHYEEVEEMLSSGRCDLAIFLKSHHGFGLEEKLLCPIDLVYIARKDHPRIHANASSEMIAQESHVTMMLASGKLANAQKLIPLQLNRNVACHVYKVSSAINIVSQSDLIGLIPKIYAYEVANKFNLQIISPRTPLTHQKFEFNWTSRNTHDPSHIWLREQIEIAVSNAWSLVKDR